MAIKVGRKILIFIMVLFNNLYVWSAFERLNNVENEVYKVEISPFKSNIIYVASGNIFYKLFRDKDVDIVEKVFVSKSDKIRDFYLDEFVFDRGFLADTKKVYLWEQNKIEEIFSVSEEEEILCLGYFRGEVFVGTNLYLYRSVDGVWKWSKVSGLPSSVAIYFLYFPKNFLKDNFFYILTSQGVYISEDMRKFKRVFGLRSYEEKEEENDKYLILNSININDKGEIYLCTSKGVFVAKNREFKWEPLFINSLKSLNVRNIIFSKLEKEIAYLSTDKGVLRIDFFHKQVKSIFEGLPTYNISWVTIGDDGVLFVATSYGLYKNNLFSLESREKVKDSLLNRFSYSLEGEPTIQEVQKKVLLYNEVSPEKIKKWRRALKLRGLLPTVSVSFDKTINYDSGVDKYYVGPYDWGVSFSWNIGDLIWNTYEDDVDTRSRLNTQLRLDILDEVNRVYFERKRIMRELKETKDPNDIEKKNMQLEELTALLDGYTGGWFSQNIK